MTWITLILSVFTVLQPTQVPVPKPVAPVQHIMTTSLAPTPVVEPVIPSSMPSVEPSIVSSVPIPVEVYTAPSKDVLIARYEINHSKPDCTISNFIWPKQYDRSGNDITNMMHPGGAYDLGKKQSCNVTLTQYMQLENAYVTEQLAIQ